MPLPHSFLLGVLALLAHEFLSDRLPAPVTIQSLFPWVLLLPVPCVLALVLRNSRARTKSRLTLRLGTILVTLSVPLVYILLLLPGELPYLAHEWCYHSYLLEIVILVTPLLLMELSVLRASRWGMRTGELATPPPFANPYRVPLVLLILLPLLVFAAGMDVLFQYRGAMLFFSWTSLGSQLGLFIFIVLLCVLLPLLFRLLMPITASVPDDLRTTARLLGFPGHAIYSMATGGRLINAALVGPLRWPRFLVLTDGLMAHLDLQSLRGVVAHEVGHAKAGHPMLLLGLFVVVPVLLLPVAELLAIDEMTQQGLLLLGGVLVIVMLVALRRIAHRFEFEADQLSAEALGGASPCIEALQGVGQVPVMGSPYRASFRHPSDAQRIENLLLCEADPRHRARFHARGRVLRWLVSMVVLVAVGLSAWAQLRHWSTDRINLLIYDGRFQEAAVALEQVPADLSEQQAATVAELREELAAGRTLYPDGGAWDDIREDLGLRALERAKQVLVTDGAAAARPWLAMALSRRDPPPEDVTLYLYCRAVAKHEEAQVRRLREHLLQRLQLRGELGHAVERGH
ncbi:MAG: M48 family metalloprotease [Planctomycetota bacterium]